MKKFERKDKNEKRRLAFEKRNVKREHNLARYGAEGGTALVMAKTTDFNRRFVAAMLALVFAISCLVVGVNFATRAEDSTAGSDDSNLVTNKTLSFNTTTGKYDLTLEAYATGKTAEKPVPLDIALVIDQSGSMITGDMGDRYEAYGDSSTQWTVSDATSGEQYYYQVLVDGEAKYYPVKAKEGTLYEAQPEMQILDVFGRGHDGDVLRLELSAFLQLINSGASSPAHFDIPTNYYGLDANGKPHKVFALTVGAFLTYNAWLYYYTDEGERVYDVDSIEEWFIGHDNHGVGIKWFDVSGNVDTSDLSKTDDVNVFYESGGNNSDIESYTSWFRTYYRNKSSSNSYNYLRYDSGNDWRGNSTWSILVGNRYIDFVGQHDSTITAGNNVRKNYDWFSDGGTVAGNTGIPLYLPVDGYNDLYYIDDDGNEVDISNNANGVAYQETDTIYTGQLYRATGITRLEALKEAVSEFSEAVAQDASDNNVDHRIAMIGFAGNQTPALSVTGGTANYSGNNYKYDYVNTGLFLNGDFKSYKEITEYNYISYSAYINRHYYIQDSGTYVPVYYASNGYWYRITGGYPVTQGTSDSGSTRRFYEVITTYQPLTDANYHDALISAKDNDSTSNGVNDYIDQSIAKLGDYGGTYTSYGMTMANKVFENNPISEGETRKRIIVVFTDGEPGGNGYEEAIAGEALSDGITAKEENGATVYTIGLFKSTPKTEVEEFMNSLSSNSSVSRVNTYASDNKTASTNYGCGDLDPSAVYYYQNSDGKTYSVQAKRNKQSSLGWWARETTSTGTTYWTTMPYEDSSDSRSGRETFYSDPSCRNAVYSPQYGTTYYTKHGSSVYETRYEYRWYDSDNRICEPMTSESDSNTDHIQFFALTTPTSSGTTGYYMPVSTASALKEAFTSITESISGTQLDSTAILRDVVNTTNFDLADATVTCYTALGKQDTENGGISFDPETPVSGGITAAWDTTSTNRLDVTGFDYSANYIAYGKEANETEGTAANQGKKLIVKIQGLTPIATGNGLTSNSLAGIYTPGESGAEDTEIAAFPSPMLDRQPVTLHVGESDTDAKFSAILGLEPVTGATADYSKVVLNDGDNRTLFNGSGTDTWKDGTGTNVAVDDSTAYLEYIRNSDTDMSASDYNVSATLAAVNDDAASYTYSWSLTENGTRTALSNSAIALGTDNLPKHIYISSDVNNRTVTINEVTTGEYANTSRAFRIGLGLTKDGLPWSGTVSAIINGTDETLTFTDGALDAASAQKVALANGQSMTLDVPAGSVLTLTPEDAQLYIESVKYKVGDAQDVDPGSSTTIDQNGIVFTVTYTREEVTDTGISDGPGSIGVVLYAIAGVLFVAAGGTGVYGYRRKRRNG